MALNFPSVSGLSNGHTTIIGDTLYTLNKTSNTVFYWSASLAENPDDRYLNVTGDTVTGNLGINGTTKVNITNSSLATDANGNIISGGAPGDGIVYAWANVSVVADAISSVNGSGCNVTRTAKGTFQVTFNTAMPDAYYTVSGTTVSKNDRFFNCGETFTNTGFQVIIWNSTATKYDVPFNFMVIR